jgi:hypothetical protein
MRCHQRALPLLSALLLLGAVGMSKAQSIPTSAQALMKQVSALVCVHMDRIAQLASQCPIKPVHTQAAIGAAKGAASAIAESQKVQPRTHNPDSIPWLVHLIMQQQTTIGWQHPLGPQAGRRPTRRGRRRRGCQRCDNIWLARRDGG